MFQMKELGEIPFPSINISPDRLDCATGSHRADFYPESQEAELKYVFFTARVWHVTACPCLHPFVGYRPKISYIARLKPELCHGRAGNLNNAMYNEGMSGHYIALFDAAMEPHTLFLQANANSLAPPTLYSLVCLYPYRFAFLTVSFSCQATMPFFFPASLPSTSKRGECWNMGPSPLVFPVLRSLPLTFLCVVDVWNEEFGQPKPLNAIALVQTPQVYLCALCCALSLILILPFPHLSTSRAMRTLRRASTSRV